jgi:hypothetical protein
LRNGPGGYRALLRELGGGLLNLGELRNSLSEWSEVRCAKGEGGQILLLLNGDDHLLEIVRCNVALATTTPAVAGILSLDVRM